MNVDIVTRARFGFFKDAYEKDLHCEECSEFQSKDTAIDPVYLEFRPPDEAICPKCGNEVPRYPDLSLKLYLVIRG